MQNLRLSIHGFPKAILHIDGDAFFASCEQSRDAKLKGRLVICGRERGIVASMSYEAKARGVTRAMRIAEVQRICPDAIMLPSDYETYSLLSKRFFAIVRRYTPDVEEYSIDECFADLTGLRRPLKMKYITMAQRIKQDLDAELGFTFSVGLGPNKVIAKIASKWKKPSEPSKSLFSPPCSREIRVVGSGSGDSRRCLKSMADDCCSIPASARKRCSGTLANSASIYQT
jgi:DNA polymerase IV